MNPSYNNSFGSFNTAPQGNPMAGGGDVILSSGPSKNSSVRKWVVLIIVIVVVALLVVLGIWFFVPKVMENLGATGALNRYGEYLSKYEEGSDSQYFTELKRLYDEFLNEAEKDEKYKDKMIELKAVSSTIDEAALLNDFESLDQDKVFEKYTKDGYAESIKYVFGFYERNNLTDEAKEYVIGMKYYYTVYLDVLKTYDENGCIVNGEVNDTCAKRAEQANSILVGGIKSSFDAKDESERYASKVMTRLLSSYDEIKGLAE